MEHGNIKGINLDSRKVDLVMLTIVVGFFMLISIYL